MPVQGIAVEHQAVRQDLNLYFLHHGRKAAKGLDQTGITVNFDGQLVDNAVVRPFLLVEIPVSSRYLVQGVGQVEGHFPLLRI